MSFFLGNKKRDLSGNSRYDEDSKKLWKQSDSLSSLSDELFADGLNLPELAKLLVCSLRNIEAQVKDLFKVNEESKISEIKVTESLDPLSKKIDELETEIKNKDGKSQLLENRVEIMEEESKSQGKEIDDLEQYSRTNCLLLHGVVETNAECRDDIIILLKNVQKSLVLMLSKKTLIGAIG